MKQTEYKTLVRTPLDTTRPFGTHTLRQSPKLEAVSLFAPEALVHLKCQSSPLFEVYSRLKEQEKSA